MLDIGWSELLLVAVVAVVVVGPKELPKLMRTFGFYAGKLRRAASDFQRQFEEAMVESEAEEVRKNIEAIQGSLGDQPMMMPQTALGEPIRSESMEAIQAEAHELAQRIAPSAKTPNVKKPRAKTPGPKLKRKPARAKATNTKAPRSKTPRAKAATTKRAPAKPRKPKVPTRAAAKPAAKRTSRRKS